MDPTPSTRAASPTSTGDAAAVEALAGHLDDLAATMDPREQALLRSMLVAAMDPLDRRRVLGGSGFTREQQAVLDDLESPSSGYGDGEGKG